MAKRKLIIEIISDPSKASRGFKQAQASVTGFDRAVGVSVRSLAKLGAAVAAFDVLAKSVRAGVSEFAEQQRVAAQTQAVLQSTGAVAGVTAKQVDQLATSISAYSGIDDEAVKAGENLLLTFTQIRNGVGKGNDIFNQATVAVTDLSVAMGIDAKKAALQVGKALNDPERGYARLQRIGVQFTKEQANQIKSFVKFGQTAKAQKVILAELTREFGGSARALGQTLPGQVNRLRESLRNIGGDIVRALAAPFANGLDAINNYIGAIQKAQGTRAKFNVAIDGLQNLGSDILKIISEQLRRVDFQAVVTELNNKLTAALSGIARFLNRIDWSAVGRAIGDGLKAGIAATTRFLGSVDWAFVGTRIVEGIRAFLTGVDWKAVTVGVIRLLVAAFKANLALLKGVGGALAGAVLDGIKTGFVALGNAAKKLALRVVIKILEPFNIKVLGKAIVPGMNALISSLKDKLAEMEQVAKDGSKKVADALAGASSPLGGQNRSAAVPTPTRTKTIQSTTTTSTTGRTGITADQRNNWFDSRITRQLDRVQDIATLAGQIKALRKIGTLLQQRIAASKDVTRKLNLEDQLVSVRRQTKTLAEQQTQQKQFGALGLSPNGGEITPGVKALRRQLGSISTAVEGTLLDTKKTRSLLSRIRKVLGGGLGQLSEEVRAKVRELLNGLNDELKNGQNGPLTKTTALNTDRILAGLGLGPQAERALRARLSRFNSAGVALTGSGSGAMVQVQSTVVLDGRVVAKSTTKHQQKGRKRNPPPRRGPNAGIPVY